MSSLKECPKCGKYRYHCESCGHKEEPLSLFEVNTKKKSHNVAYSLLRLVFPTAEEWINAKTEKERNELMKKIVEVLEQQGISDEVVE